jgi:BirA family biotin operon repressor/biotin-[acetyl-CoA-carboxylase] ligase
MDGRTYQILNLLRERTGFVSGQAVSERTGVSRMTVCKHVDRLRRLGYRIESAPRKGYRLVSVPDLPLPEELGIRLATQHLGRTYRFLDACGSTNGDVLQMASQGAPHGTVVAADRQTAGRGRMGRQWVSPPGANLYFSVLLRPAAPPFVVPQLALVAGLSVAEAVEQQAPAVEAGVKWPNDVLVAGRKLAGILCEMEAEADAVHAVVVGIGLNVNSGRDDFPPLLRKRATSLRIESGCEIGRVDMLAAVLNALEANYNQWAQGGLASLLPAMEARSVLKGKYVTVSAHRREMAGVVTELDADGCLVLEQEGGTQVHVPSGEVHVISRWAQGRGIRRKKVQA